MRLPQLPCNLKKYARQITAFAGLNLSENTKEGELRDSLGLSTAKFPALTQRIGRTPLTGFSTPTDLFEWDGKLIVVDGTNLLYDGGIVGTVTAGEKQFAVVNTKLCIFPDKKYLDLKSKEFKSLDASTSSVAGTNVVFSQNSLAMTGTFTSVSEDFMHIHQSGEYVHMSTGFLTRKYAAVEWSASAGWTLTGETEVAVDNLAAGGVVNGLLAVGDLVMLQKSEIDGSYVLNTRKYDNRYSEGKVTYGAYAANNDKGYYGIVTALSGASSSDSEPGLIFYTEKVTFQVKNALHDSLNLSTQFFAGDRLRISGCTLFPANNSAKEVHLVVSAVEAGKITFKNAALTAGTETSVVTICRELPDLTYICESENRLWGVSNTEKTIYASALGKPENFFVYDGVSTDGYAVAVGSEGNFTGICRYAASVLCFKEKKLHKVLGSFPAEYALNDYDIDGVQAGSERSLKILNDVLYYKGVFGVYAFAGGAPQRISYNLGTELLREGVGGTDGMRYYLSCLSGTGAVLYTYDALHGLWMKEDASRTSACTTMGGQLYLLQENKIYRTDPCSTECFDWMAEFVPFTETEQLRKGYSKLLLRLELSRGAWLKVETRSDRENWTEVCKMSAENELTRSIPIRMTRCDRFCVRLTGRGRCTIRSLVREFSAGSEG